LSDDGIVVTTIDTPRTEAPATPVPEFVKPLFEKEPAAEAAKTFTQDQLEKQIGQRLARERAKYDRELQTERELRIRLEERNVALAPKADAKPNDGRPDIKDYSDIGEYTADMAKWATKGNSDAVLAEFKKSQETERANATQQQLAGQWHQKVAAAAAEIPNLNQVLLDSADIPMSDTLKAAIMESEEGPKLAYFLATHPEDAFRINAMTPNGAVRALTLIEVGLKSKPVTQTPAPITPIGSRQTSGPKSLTSTMSQEEFEKRRRAFISKR
jgi:hypothetical protein